MSTIYRSLASRTTYLLLLALSGLTITVIGMTCIGVKGVDELSYVALAEGILHGHYSQWLQFDPPIPDTFRTPGYPLYVAAFIGLFDFWRPAMIGTQLLMYVAGLHLMFKVMDRWNTGLVGRNLLLLLLLPSANVTSLIFMVTPEIPVFFCIAVLVYVDVVKRPSDPLSAVGVGLLLGFIFQCRPVYLLFPLIRTLITWWNDKKRYVWGIHLLTMAVFIGTLLPFALWNRAHHGILSPTPLEGGGGVFNLGYWCGRLPGLPKERSFENFIADEMIRFVPASSLATERAAYEQEWDSIDAQVAPLLTSRDSLMRAIINGRPNICYSYNSRFVIARERVIKQRTLMDIKAHPGYYLAFKAYSAVRLWVVGVDRGRFSAAGPVGRILLIAAFLFTFILFAGAIYSISRSVRWGMLRTAEIAHPLAWVLYTGFIYVPFVIQTRYTSSVRAILYMVMAAAMTKLWEAGRKNITTPEATLR